MRVGPAARALLKSADRRWRPGGGEIWLTEQDCWMAVAGEPALLRIPDPAAPGPALRRALADRHAFAVAPSSAVADALIAAGLDAERTLVLPPYLSAWISHPTTRRGARRPARLPAGARPRHPARHAWRRCARPAWVPA